MLLTAMGIFGALALVTTRRTREISIRMTLRAQSVCLVLWQTLWLVVTGLLVSVPLTMALDRGLRSQIVGTATPSVGYQLLAVAARGQDGLSADDGMASGHESNLDSALLSFALEPRR